jgi:hypothetical protein
MEEHSSPSVHASMSQHSTLARSDGYFDHVHHCLEQEIRRGHSSSILLLLSLPEIHEDALFWRTCRSHAGIASAVLADYLCVTGESQAGPDESNSRMPMSKNELYALLKRCGDDKSIISETVDAMERGLQTSVDLASLCSLLQARAAPPAPSPGKRNRDGSAAEPSSDPPPPPNRGIPASVLREIARTALPGSSVDIDSFEAIGPPLFQVKGGPVREAHERQGGAVTSGRAKQAFSHEEDDAIVRGIARFAVGPSRFTDIYLAYKSVWKPGRTAQQLADHWRSVLKERTIRGQGGAVET